MAVRSKRDDFVSRLRAGRFAVTLEITPPQKPLPEVLGRRARMLGEAAHAVNVIERPGRLSSLFASEALLEAGLEPVWHVANRGRARGDLQGEIEMAARAGIRCALCVRGDHSAVDRSDTPKLRELIAMLAVGLPDACIGATANQFGPRDRVVANLIPKLESGAQFVQTQPVFDWERFSSLAEEIKTRVPQARMVPMLMPLLSPEAAAAIGDRLGVGVSDDRVAELEGGGSAAGWDRFAQDLSRLHESPLVDGVAIMTREMDPPPAVTGRIAQLLARLAD